VPEGDSESFVAWSKDMMEAFNWVQPDPDAALRAEASMVEFTDYLRDVVERRKRHPSDDLVSRLAEEDGEYTLTESELISSCILFFEAGFETTVSMLGNLMYALLRNPMAFALLRADPSLAAGAVEETLRWDPPIQWFRRLATQDVSLRGVTIKAGDGVVPVIAAANRDPLVFTDPDAFDVERSENPHIAFGRGVHQCIGAPLSRMEGRVVLETVLERTNAIEPVLDWRPDWFPWSMVRCLDRLPVHVSA
jgi:cytochrome P450